MNNRLMIAGVSASLALLFGCGGGGGGANGSSDSAPSYFLCVANSNTSPGVTTYALNPDTGVPGAEASHLGLGGSTYPLKIVAHPSLNVVYVTGSDNKVHALTVGEENGALAEIDSETTGASSSYYSAAVTPDGRYLYVGNTHTAAHSISIFSIASDGRLTPAGTLDMTANNLPYDMAADPRSNYLYVLDQGWGFPPKLHAYAIGSGGALGEATGSPAAIGGNPRTLAIRPDNLYVCDYGTQVRQYTNATAPLTPLSPPTATATGNGWMSTIVGNSYYRYIDSPNRIFPFSIASGGALAENASYLPLPAVPLEFAGGVDGKFMYFVFPDTDQYGWATRDASTGVLSGLAMASAKDYPRSLVTLKFTH